MAKTVKQAASLPLAYTGFWLMKTEPETFSFADLLQAPQKTTAWEGVRNYQARNLMRDAFKVGDQVFIYHSSCAEPGVVGTAKVVKVGLADDSALDPQSPYFDAKSQADGVSRWCLVKVQAERQFQRLVALKEIKEHPKLQNMLVIRRGMRLSIQPVAAADWRVVVSLGG